MTARSTIIRPPPGSPFFLDDPRTHSEGVKKAELRHVSANSADEEAAHPPDIRDCRTRETVFS